MKKKLFLFLPTLIVMIVFLGNSVCADSWTSKTPMQTPGRGYLHSATVGNKIYIFNGWACELGYIPDVEMYDPATDSWESKAPIPIYESHYDTAVLGNKIFIVGGGGVLEYDTLLDTWEILPQMNKIRMNTACVGFNGKVYAFGGRKGSDNRDDNAVEVYDPAIGTWQTLAPMPTKRCSAVGIVYNNKIRVFGGWNNSITGNSIVQNKVEEYDPATNTWVTKAPMQISRAGFGLTETGGKFYFMGGHDGSLPGYTKVTEEYDPESETWVVRTPMPTGRVEFGAEAVNGKIYSIGGTTVGKVCVNTVDEYTPDSTNNMPIANAGLDQTVQHGDLVTLDASSSTDPDANYPMTYFWEITSKPSGSAAVLDAPASVSPKFIADLPGEYNIQLVVTDNLGISSTPDTMVVSTYNTAPVADAGVDQQVTSIGTYVYLDGTDSYDVDDEGILFYSWSILLKPANSEAALSDATTASPFFVADANGDYTLQLIVSDQWADSTPDTVIISFNNLVPVADAGINQSVVNGDVVTLNGLNSFDSNLDQLTYLWSLVSKPEGSLATISDPAAGNTDFTADLAGTYVVELTVNDGFVDSLPSTCSIVAISFEDAITSKLQEAIDVINSFDPSSFKNKNLGNALTNKINAVLSSIDEGLYQDAYDQLANDILKKTNGCAVSGAPDNNDWIKECVSQNQIYALIMEAINFLRNI